MLLYIITIVIKSDNMLEKIKIRLPKKEKSIEKFFSSCEKRKKFVQDIENYNEKRLKKRILQRKFKLYFLVLVLQLTVAHLLSALSDSLDE